jgi:antitoxin component YwqK of YwqJK toxin-antitoxin module
MKKLSIYIAMLWMISCVEDKQEIVTLYRSVSAKDISVKQDVVYNDGALFTGVLYELEPETLDTILVAAYLNGLLHGRVKKWYANGQLMEERSYTDGQKNGMQTAFWENGNPKFAFMAKADAYEGELKEWTVDGKLIHLANFKAGQEEGVQKLWYDNGKIRANYVITNGRRYGLLGTKNCKNVSDSIFIVQ